MTRSARRHITIRIRLDKFVLPRLSRRARISAGALATLLIVAEVIVLLQPYLVQRSYALGEAGALLSPISQAMAEKLHYDVAEKQFLFNQSYTPSGPERAQANGNQIKAITHEDASRGVTVSDPVSKVDFKLTPSFRLLPGKQDGNRIVYPLSDGNGWAVYAMHSVGVKEDILLNESKNDRQSFAFKLDLGDGFAARLQADGSIGIYGNTLLSGNVTTGSDKDAQLLQKARQQAPKDTLLFSIPAPTVIESGKKKSDVRVAYELDGSILKVVASGLKKANYPLSIDPSIYVATAQEFMNGNNETNIDFDVADKLIRKGSTTGARFDSWSNNTDLPAAQWGSSSVATGGYIYTIGGTTFNGQLFTSQGAANFVVPSGTTSLTVKMWGGGGGGGGGGTATAGGAGGGGGYVSATLAVTPGETLNVYVGGGGNGGNNSILGSGQGGGGGGYSSLYSGSTALAIAAGGAGGGGGGSRSAGGAGGTGGAGGGTSGVAGATVNGSGGGGGGTASAGGAAGTGGSNTGTAGSSLTGGAGANGATNEGPDGGGATGGLASGGNGGSGGLRTGGGGGGGGYYGGGGAAASSNSNAGTNSAGGGGGGSSYTVSNATSVTNTAGSGTTPGNSNDSFRSGAGNGASGGTANNNGGGGANGLIVISYGGGATAVTQAVNWAHFSTSTGTIDSANPGNGNCSGWCSTSAYNLPAARANFSLVAYNGYLYAIGGCTLNPCTAASTQNTVYIAKLGTSGEPRKWHPSDTNQANWTYWYTDTSLSSVRSYTAAVAYNNRMYLLGGLSGTTTSAPVTTVESANINPTGTLGTWTSSAALPVALYGHGAQVYNDRIYVLGGASTLGGTTLTSVYYNKINSDGTLNSWTQTSSFANGRISNGGNISVVWGAYMYVSAGCGTLNASNYCATARSDTQVASINADGSLDTWNTVGSVSNQRSSVGLVAWRGYIYEIGGCFTQDTSTGSCDTSMLASIISGAINQDGDASTVGQSVASGTSPCSGASPTDCNLPGTSNIGNLLAQTVITNGYLYVIGGCTGNTCANQSSNTAYVAVSSTGAMTKPATCPSGSYQGGAWCVDNVHTTSSNGVSGGGTAVFGGRIYIVGGFDGINNTGNILYTSVNTDGSITSWTSQLLTGAGATSVAYPYTFTRANPSSAGSNPGNLYIIGGCTGTNNASCTGGYTGATYKCSIATSGSVSGCSTSGQLQIGTIPGDSSPGLGAMSGTVYANYVYLIGGESPNQTSLDSVRYAKIDNSNNIVAVSGSSWTVASHTLATARRRASAFGYNGYLYAVGGYDGTGGSTLSDIEFIKINVSDGSLGSTGAGWKTSAVTINQRWGLSVPVSNSYAYVIGGCTSGSVGSCTARTDTVQTFQIYNNNSGSPGGFTTAANTYGTDPNRLGASSTILDGYLYVAGGCTSTTDCTTASTNVSYSAISASGALGSWSSTSAALPANRVWGKLLAAGGTLYYIGGQSNTAADWRSEVYYSTPSSGNVSSWSTASNSLPSARTKFGATVWNNRLYVVGGTGSGTGCTASNVCNTVYVSPQLNSGGDITTAWSTGSSSFNVARSGLTAVAYANNLYVFGGYDGSNYLSDSQFSQINASTGLAGSWSYSASLPHPLSQGDGFAANGYMYLVGGRTADTSCDPVTLVAPISANTAVASGNAPTGIGAWNETGTKYSGNRYGAAAAYFDGKAYVLGGGCGATITYGSPASQQTAVLAQPQVAKYSIAFDTDTDVSPSQWLLNGLDNSIGAKWQLKYRSMTNPGAAVQCSPSGAMTTWGQETNFGNVTLGTPGAYIPKNSSGANTSCARYFYFNVTVDSSQAFGYPDDVSRGPTIDDLTLQFTADPSKRLMHGRTFTGGLQQPDDTPAYNN